MVAKLVLHACRLQQLARQARLANRDADRETAPDRDHMWSPSPAHLHVSTSPARSHPIRASPPQARTTAAPAVGEGAGAAAG